MKLQYKHSNYIVAIYKKGTTDTIMFTTKDGAEKYVEHIRASGDLAEIVEEKEAYNIKEIE
ncbi:hypothetical protein ETI08_03555 [Macrococcoides goetzii]|nr:hypothetical protein [Macrococcus goetzii]TDM48227.1 hypothetical protein ETI08_03555 [Macrococcus goetzii]